MELLTIGAFARDAGLTPKAPRRYDERGLLPPAAVDPRSGYRFYDPAQLGRARLVAGLRQVGMSLARIRQVCAMPAAEAITADRAEIEAEAASRGRLAGRLGAEEARTHGRRPLLVRALGAGTGRNEPDVSLRTALPGDRPARRPLPVVYRRAGRGGTARRDRRRAARWHPGRDRRPADRSGTRTRHPRTWRWW